MASQNPDEHEEIEKDDGSVSYDHFHKTLQPFISISQTALPQDLLSQEIYLDIPAFPCWGVSTTPLIAACVQGDLQTATFLLSSGVSPNTHTPKWYLDTVCRPTTPLQAAALFGRAELITLLLTHGADINPPENEFGVTPNALPFAAAEGNVELVELLLQNGADINGSSGRDGAALHAAAYYGHLHLVSFLLAKGADINCSAGDFGTPLKAACSPRTDNTDIVRALLDAGADVDAEGEPQGLYGAWGSPLVRAASVGMAEAVKVLLERGADVNMMSESGRDGGALQIATGAGFLGVVKVLVEAGADVNARGGWYGSAVEEAAVHGYQDIFGYLIEKGASVNGMEGIALQKKLRTSRSRSAPATMR